MALPQCAILASFLLATVLAQTELKEGGTQAWKPIMYPNNDQLIIQEGDELKISCRGEGPIHFSTMSTSKTVYIGIDETSDEYTFVMYHAYADDTGWYACAEEGVEIRNDELTIDHPDTEISWIYVYVNSSTEPFAVMHTFHPISVRAGTTAVLPCRPTSPDYAVKLHIWSNPEPIEDTEFDPKIGFIFRNVTLGQAETYECKIVGSDSEDNPAYELQVTTRRNLSKPIIDEAALHHVVWGKNQTLTCSIIMPSEIRFALTWKAPSSVPKERLIHDEKSEYQGGYVTHRAFLTIVNVQEHDGGEYVCTLKGEGHNVATQTTHLQIWDPNHMHLNLSLGDDQEASLQLREGDVARWSITVDSYPENVTWTWYKGNSANPIKDVMSAGNCKFSHVQDGKLHVFRIARLSVRDTSKYTIRASTPYNVKDIIVHLNVEGHPIAHIENTLSYFMPGQSVDFTCRILSNPTGNVTWVYREYPKFPSKRDPKSITLSAIAKSVVEDKPFFFLSHVKIRINENGDLVCKVCNTVNCRKVRKLIHVSDVASPFDILHPESVTEGDDISLTCGASVYNYSDNITWGVATNSENGRISIVHKTTKFTHQAILKLRNVQKSDSGNYTCNAFDFGYNKNKTMTYFLSVKDARAPSIYETNLNNSQIMNKRKDSLHLTCHVDGAPGPKVTWLKDGYPLNKGQQYGISADSSTLHIRYFLDGDGGRYACRAESRIASVEKYVDIVTEGPFAPTIDQLVVIIETDSSNNEADRLKLTCTTVGMPIPKLTWSKDGQPLTNGHPYEILPDNSQLHIRYLLDTDSGRYSCRAENNIGVTEKYVNIKINDGLVSVRGQKDDTAFKF